MKKLFTTFLATLVFGLAGSGVWAAESADENKAEGEVSPALQKSMDPNVWLKLMNSMMSGDLQGQPMIASCVECHTDEDIARYQKDFGGMMHAMNPMMGMANPQFYGNAASGMMAPMTGMMGAPMGMMNPMTGMMMAPMGMMTPMMMAPMGMGMPGMGMPGMPAMPGMPPMGMPGTGMPGMPAMPGMAAPGMPPIGAPGMPMMPGTGMPGAAAPGAMPSPQGIMNPEQYEEFYQQWTDMMSKMMPQQAPADESGAAQ